jgi:hypothetical protein
MRVTGRPATLVLARFRRQVLGPGELANRTADDLKKHVTETTTSAGGAGLPGFGATLVRMIVYGSAGARRCGLTPV